MSPRDDDHAQRVEETFWAALDLDPGARGAFLEERCGEDAGLRRDVEEMLAHYEAAGDDFLAGRAFTFQAETSPASTEPGAAEIPRNVGPYHIVRELGKGGMGEVYEARQNEPIKRRVALKLIKRGLETRALLARFDAERQALALMDHPAVARVFDAGECDDGRPYFAMEYVEGLPITEHCDRHRLTTNERLELLAEVCEGVQHAHQKALIHRDLKPSNVLVTFQDDASKPKIIDFGIARAMAQPLTEKTLVTGLGQVMGTPEYMSPEQAEMTEQNVDTRTDVYALGVMLYQLLTGVLPFDTQQLREGGLDEARRVIREVDPSRPSTRVTAGDEDSEARAKQRQTTPQHLASALRGDLDWITMKALEKERTRRYATPMDLAADLRRCLRDEPVHAHPPSNAYRLRKLVTRNKLATVFAATVTVLVVGLAVTMTVLRSQAEVARVEAQARAVELELVTNFQASMLAEIDAASMGTALVDDLGDRVREALAADGLDETALEDAMTTFEGRLGRISSTDAAVALIDAQILERAVSTIDEEFTNEPEVRAALLHTVGVTYGALGRDAKAVPLLEEAIRTRRARRGDAHPSTLTSVNSLCETLRRMGEFARAMGPCSDALETAERALGADHRITLLSMNNMGYLLSMMGNDDEALALYRRALEGSRRALGSDHPETIRSINNVGALLVEAGALDEALVYYEESLAGCRATFGPEDPKTLAAISNMGGLYYNMGKPAEASVHLAEALEIRRRTLGRDHPETLASTQNMGILLQSMGRFDEAVVYQRDAIESARRVLGEDHPSTLQMISGLAVSLRELGEVDAALELLEPATATLRETLGDDHPRTLGALAGMSQILMAMDRSDEALALGREVLDARRRVLGEENPRTLSSHGNLGRLLRATGRPNEALTHHRIALDGFRRVLGDEHPSTLTAIHDQASLLLDLGATEEALALIGPAEGAARRSFTGARVGRLGTYLTVLGVAEAANDAFDAAETHLEEAYAILSEDGDGTSLPEVVDGLVMLYERWHATAPDAGHDARARTWSERKGVEN